MNEEERKALSKIASDIKNVVPGVVDILPLRLGEGFYSLEVIIKKKIKVKRG